MLLKVYVHVQEKVLGVTLKCVKMVVDSVMPGLLLISLIHRLGRISTICFCKLVRNKLTMLSIYLHT
jgi:hypothetical protein